MNNCRSLKALICVGTFILIKKQQITWLSQKNFSCLESIHRGGKLKYNIWSCLCGKDFSVSYDMTLCQKIKAEKSCGLWL